VLVSLLIALEEPAPAGPPVAPPAAVAEASPEPEPCALFRVPQGPTASPLMALEDPAPADPPVAPPAAASPEPPACASARVEPSIRTEDKAIVVNFMGLSFHRGKDNQPFHSSVPNKRKISLGNLDPDRRGNRHIC
jgi:hypothetical protein